MRRSTLEARIHYDIPIYTRHLRLCEFTASTPWVVWRSVNREAVRRHVMPRCSGKGSCSITTYAHCSVRFGWAPTYDIEILQCDQPPMHETFCNAVQHSFVDAPTETQPYQTRHASQVLGPSESPMRQQSSRGHTLLPQVRTSNSCHGLVCIYFHQPAFFAFGFSGPQGKKWRY